MRSAKSLEVIFDEYLKWKPHIWIVISCKKKCFYISKEVWNILDTRYQSQYDVFQISSICINVWYNIEWGLVYKKVSECL